jgi:hypothetical protein
MAYCKNVQQPKNFSSWPYKMDYISSHSMNNVDRTAHHQIYLLLQTPLSSFGQANSELLCQPSVEGESIQKILNPAGPSSIIRHVNILVCFSLTWCVNQHVEMGAAFRFTNDTEKSV